MARRRRNLPVDTEAVVEKASEIKDTAKELAGAGSDAVKEFVSTTGTAAREFASSTAQAAKELLDATEQAVERLNQRTQPRRRGRRIIRTGLVLGAGAAVLANQTAREAITGQIRRLRGGREGSWDTSAELRQQASTPSVVQS